LISKANITESTLNMKYSLKQSTYHQYQNLFDNKEQGLINEQIKENVTNNDEDFGPLSTL